jgi:NAD(P)H-dependent FMN reductase
MRKIVIISSSVRTGRLSHRVALFIQKYIQRNYDDIDVSIVDLLEYDFPLFYERLMYMQDPSAALLDYARRIVDADGMVVVAPVYNASFPAALKNAVDVLVSEWVNKPVVVASVTYGAVPGISTVQQLQTLFLKLGARVAAPVYTVINAGGDFAEDGTPRDSAMSEKFAAAPIKEFMWIVDKTQEK